ncbi:MAG: OmpH family outer membrane protein [Deltaproteobacteria bacterium]
MKKVATVALGVFIATAFILTGVVQAQGLRVAYVNFQAFAQKSKRYQAQQKKLSKLLALKQGELEKKKEQLVTLQEDLKKQGPMLKEETRNARLKEIGIKEMELKLAEKQAQTFLQNEQREAMELLRRDIRKIIEQIRKQRKLTLIFDAVALLGADESLDITDVVVRAYDAGAPAAARPAPRAPARQPKAPVRSRQKR